MDENINLIKHFEKELAADEKVRVAGIDIDGILRGKILSKEKFLGSLKSGGLGMCN